LGSEREGDPWKDGGEDNLLDLISSYDQGPEKGGAAMPASGTGKGKAGQK